MLELKEIGLWLEGDGHAEDKQVLRDVSLSVNAGELIAVTGPNGGGKSTLAKIVMGIISPTSGQIIFNGKDITKLDTTRRAKLGISMAFQQPVKFKGLTVKDMFRIAMGKDFTMDLAARYLARIGMDADEYLGRELDSSLSGGEMKRIELASVLARNAKLTILDEPEAGIDLWNFQNVIETLQETKKHTDGAIVIISHQERILAMADKIAVVAGGMIMDFGDRDAILPKIIEDTK